MPVQQGTIELLQHPASKELLKSTIPARLAYVWTDGTPRVVPIWFHWNGRELVLGAPEWVCLLDFQTRFPSALPCKHM